MTHREQRIFIDALNQSRNVRVALALRILESLDREPQKQAKVIKGKRSKKR
jgi:hypothetical protein